MSLSARFQTPVQHQTRRDFLTATSLAIAGAVFGARRLGAEASVHTLSPSVVWSSSTADALLPEPLAHTTLQMLATSAVEAAKGAGATYADIRVAEQHELMVYGQPGAAYPFMRLTTMFSYGCRALVDGTWSFVHGSVPTVDALAASAREAVTVARMYARVSPRHQEFTPAPATQGEWATPCAVDPFTVPLQHQAGLMSAYCGMYGQSVNRFRHGGLSNLVFNWKREKRVFASSEGTLVMQTLCGSRPEVIVYGDCRMGPTHLLPLRPAVVSGGYETVDDPAIQDELRGITEEAIRFASLPRGTLDVGRYPVVFDGLTFGMIMGRTLAGALEADRVLGYEADASGTSFLSPPMEVVGTRVVSPLLTITGHRAMPSISAVKWDDDGVEPQSFPLIREGVLTNYAASCQTAATLTTPASTLGCTVAATADLPPLVRAPHLTVTPSTRTATLGDLCREIKHGLLVRDMTRCSTDQQLASGSLAFQGWDGVVLEIVNGVPVRRIRGNGAEFRVRQFWQALVALGDTSTVRESTSEVYKGMPWQSLLQSVTAPAGLIKEVNIVSMK